MAYHAIGNFQFVRLAGEPLVAHRQGELIARPGVNNLAALRTGIRGREFNLQSAVDCVSVDAARALAILYQASVFGDLARLWIDDIDYLQTGTKYLITRIDNIRIKACAVMVGELVNVSPGSPGAWLEADWTLAPVAV
jgi:hypothetical protein